MSERATFEQWFDMEFGDDYVHTEAMLLAWQACAEQKDKEIADLTAKNEIYEEALEHLAKLGNEPLYGTSEGNTIAKIALVRAERV